MRDTAGVGQPPSGSVVGGLPAHPGQLPEFVPMPRGKGTEFYSGLRRGAMNGLVLPCAGNNFNPPVRSVSLRKPGGVKGTRVVVLEGNFGKQMGLLTYLRHLQKQQEKQMDRRSKEAPEPQPA